MQIEKRSIAKVRPEGKFNTIAIREESIQFMQGDDEFTIQFDSPVNLQNFLNIMLLGMHRKFQNATSDTEYGRSSYTYDYEVLNNADMIADLRTAVRDANVITVSD